MLAGIIHLQKVVAGQKSTCTLMVQVGFAGAVKQVRSTVVFPPTPPMLSGGSFIRPPEARGGVERLGPAAVGGVGLRPEIGCEDTFIGTPWRLLPQEILQGSHRRAAPPT